jgi:CBS domain-containing protein
MKISEIMTTDLFIVSPETKISEAAKILLENHIHGIPVVDNDNKLVGIICQSDIITQQKKLPLPTIFTLFDGLIPLSSTHALEKEIQRMSATTVEEAMTPDPMSVTPDTEIEEVVELMVKRNFHTIPVVENEQLVGIVGKEDVLKTLIQ